MDKEMIKKLKEAMKKEDERLRKLLPEVRKLNDSDLLKIIEVFDCCMECWNVEGAAKCKYQKIRKKIGLSDCSCLEIAKRYKLEKK